MLYSLACYTRYMLQNVTPAQHADLHGMRLLRLRTKEAFILA